MAAIIAGIISKLYRTSSSSADAPADVEQTAEGTVGSWSLGDPVCVFSRGRGSWLRDGTVVQTTAEPKGVDAGSNMPVGAVKVLYDDGNYAKWVPPAAFEVELRRADFIEGDKVSVFCRGMGLWVADGTVVQVLSEAAVVEGSLAMPAGAVKVAYANDSAAKWIPPEEFGKELRRVREWNAEIDKGQCSTTASEDGRASATETSELAEPSVASLESCCVGVEASSLSASIAPAAADCVGELSVGDPVCVFSRQHGTWLRDGAVVRVLAEATTLREGQEMPAGSVLVGYDDGSHAKWVPPAAFGVELRRADFVEGDKVSVYCRSMGLWVADGLVMQVLSEAVVVEGSLAMPAGAVKVAYANDSAAKWIPPEEFGKELRVREWNAEIDNGQCSTTASEDGKESATETSELAGPSVASLESCCVGVEASSSSACAAPATADCVGELSVGDPVCVFSRQRGTWLRDGAVVRVLAESTTLREGLEMPAGSVLVGYDDGSHAKWVPPAAFGVELRRADFVEGDKVSVYCRSMGLWVADGLVMQVLSEAAVVDSGLSMPAGAVKVAYANETKAKWIPPEEFGKELQAQRQWSVDNLEDELNDTLSAERVVPELEVETLEVPVPLAATEASEALNEAEITDVSAPVSPASASPISPSQKFNNNLRRSLSRLGSVVSLADDAMEEEEEDDDAYIVSAAPGIESRFAGRYRLVGEHRELPKYKNAQGAIIYCDGHWKMNIKDDTLHWCYESRGPPGDAPPSGTWTAFRFYGNGKASGPQVAKAAEAELFAVSGATGTGRAVNGRYTQVGEHNDYPKYKNRRGAIIFFDGYWKMNERDNVLAWRYSVKGELGPQPPAGEWAAHWSYGKEQPAAQLRMCGGEAGKTV